MWVLAALGVAVLVVGAFFVGRETAPEASGPETLADAVEQTARGDMEVGDFSVGDLLDALQENDGFSLGGLGDLLENLGDNR